MLYLSLDLPASFQLNYPELPDSWLPFQFPFFEDILDVFVDSSNVFLKEFGKLLLSKPDRLVEDAYLNTSLTVFGLVEQKLRIAIGVIGGRYFVHRDIFLLTFSAKQAILIVEAFRLIMLDCLFVLRLRIMARDLSFAGCR